MADAGAKTIAGGQEVNRLIPAQVSIRPANVADAIAIANLLPDLGYSASVEQVLARLERLLPAADHAIFVAESRECIIGICHVCGVHNLASAGYAEVMEIVVEQAFQRKGVGKLLLRAAERWATACTYPRIRLRSGVHREDAHKFYEKLGYEKSRASYAFELFL